MTLKNRVSQYYSLNLRLLSLPDKDLTKILKSGVANKGWGLNQTIHVAGKKIFVKRIPLTQREYDHAFSTKNHFSLPTYYSFGVGSGGFGAYRELISHLKTTNWVLNNETESFPLLYHYRILPRPKRKSSVDRARHREYVQRWNNNQSVSRYVLERSRAPYEIVLFLEHFPFTAKSWILDHTEKFDILVKDIKTATDFLKRKGVMHFDLHLANVLTDGKKAYITDFGLCLDRDFDFSVQERKFFNKYLRGRYDYGEFLSTLGYSLFFLYDRLPSSKKTALQKHLGIEIASSPFQILSLLFKNLKVIRQFNLLKIDSRFSHFLVKNQDTIVKLAHFYTTLRSNPKKNTRYPRLSLQK